MTAYRRRKHHCNFSRKILILPVFLINLFLCKQRILRTYKTIEKINIKNCIKLKNRQCKTQYIVVSCSRHTIALLIVHYVLKKNSKRLVDLISPMMLASDTMSLSSRFFQILYFPSSLVLVPKYYGSCKLFNILYLLFLFLYDLPWFCLVFLFSCL